MVRSQIPLILCTLLLACRVLAEDSAIVNSPPSVSILDNAGSDDGFTPFAIDSNESDQFFVQENATDSVVPPAPRTLSRSQVVAARRRRSTYRLPSMFGDYLGGSILHGIISDQAAGFTQATQVTVPSGGVGIRRVKIAENNSPIPRDRIIANFNFFNNVVGGIGDVNRYTFGFERTFYNQSSSIEFLIPFASTLGSDQVVGNMLRKDTEFGDLAITFKTLLFERDEYVVAGGVGVTAPTGSGGRVFDATGNELIRVSHTNVYISPYLAALRNYDSGWYWQSFLQLDVDANGSQVKTDLAGTTLQRIGVLQDTTLLLADVGVGYRFSELEEDGSPAIAVTAELHYATTLQDSDSVTNTLVDIRNVTNRFDVLNLTLGLNVRTKHGFSIRPAIVIPLSDGYSKQFDYEAMVQMNYWR